MEISNNSSSVARSCWKKFYWRYHEKLTPISQSPAISLGKAIHEAFDLYYKGKSIPEVITHLKNGFDNEIHNAGPEESEYLVIAKFTALGMFGNFPYFTTFFDEVESEKEFKVRLMPDVEFKGRVDGVVKKAGKWWVRELKTTSQTQRQFNQRASTSTQGTAYVWALRKLGYDVQGIMYDFIKRPLLRKHVREDQYEFGSRILTDYRKRKDFYFGQIFSYRNQHEIDLWEQDSKYLAEEMKKKRKSGKYYRNQHACFNYNYECAYKKICFEPTLDNLMLQLYFKRDGKSINEKGEADA